jgi:serine/threonine protein kinase/tetratricopeptide (TPR) repeat protein
VALTSGTRLGAYEIVSVLGAGGMGEVYRARDPRLDRDVAIKVLPPALTCDALAKQRFVMEAKAASALDHPNICTIHEINETPEGQLYLVMAYYDGETLSQKIARGPLVLDEALDVAVQVGQGLANAHAAGFVHRDIKPANVMVTPGGTVKILDFGLAKLAGTQGVTRTGITLGTVAYMSPEQARGHDVDHRSDIWSLGAVLYETLTGTPPFTGDSLLSISHAILERDPPPLLASASRAQAVVSRALRKSREHRHQSATELLGELRAAQGAAPPGAAQDQTEVPFIAVLPFTNMSPDPENEYFSDGLTEEIIADLSQIRALRVISRTSIMRLKGTDKDLKTIGRELNARYLLEGSVRKAGYSLRITAQLIDAADDVHVWADKYSGSLEDVFDIQERVSRAIVKALHVTLSPHEDRRVAERPIQDVRAYECYLRARHEIWRFTPEGLERALSLLRQGLEIVGDNALLYGTLGGAYWQHINAGLGPVERFLQQAEECVVKVFQLEPDSARGHYVRGLIWLTRGNIQKAVRALSRALVLDPDNSEALFMHAALLRAAGRDSTAEAARLLEIDPLTPHNLLVPAWGHLVQGHFSLAVDEFRRWHERDPESPLAALLLGDALVRNDRVVDAEGTFERLAARFPQTMFGQLGLFLNHALRGNKAQALDAVSPASAEAARWDMQYSWEMATGYALIDERDQAIQWLTNATRRGFINYPFLSQHDPLLKNIRREKRFTELMEEVRSEWEQFEV